MSLPIAGGFVTTLMHINANSIFDGLISVHENELRIADSNKSFGINITKSGANNTRLSVARENDFINIKKEPDSEPLFADKDELLIMKMMNTSKAYEEHKLKREEAKNNFVPIRYCYGVVDKIYKTNDNPEVFRARIYENHSNEFIEIIEAPLDAFKPSDVILLALGSVFYWKAGYRYTSKGTRVKVNDFNLRRIIREKSHIRTKRVETVVDELLSIFK